MAKHLITGGAGFIGVNLASRLLRQGERVVILDNLSRRGARSNLDWLRESGNFTFVSSDIRDAAQIKEVLTHHRDVATVFHLAAQVAVTTSVIDPRLDFEVNVLGTLNVLEEVRQVAPEAVLLYSSTNKVYGGLEGVKIVERDGRYAFATLPQGIAETQPLDFHSPYGCSKGAADQYVRDYSRIYGLRTIVFRQSCIYGYRQFGVEDQGWVSWFTIAAVFDLPITIYGDGKQVRDLLFIDDLVEAGLMAVAQVERTQGRVYNIGGGPSHQASVLEVVLRLQELLGKEVRYSFAPWRPGDQRVYLSDLSQSARDFGWHPVTPVEEGLEKLVRWAQSHRQLFADVADRGP